MHIMFLLFALFLSHSLAEECNGRAVITDNNGYITDHQGPGNYSHPKTCVWKFEPTQSYDTIAIKFTSFDLAFVDMNHGDFLDFRQSAQGREYLWYTGRELPEPITFTNQDLTIIFYASASTPYTGRGFSLQYSASSCPGNCFDRGLCWQGSCLCNGGYSGPDCSQLTCDNGCGEDKQIGSCVTDEQQQGKKRCQCKQGYFGGDCQKPYCDREEVYMTESSGTLTDHHQELSGKSFSLHNATCRWLIQPKDADFVSLEFTSFDTEEGYDVVTVYDAPNADPSRVLGTFSGSSIPPALRSTGRAMFITFSTDEGLPSVGFKANYKGHSFSNGVKGGFVALIAFIFLFLGVGLGIGGSYAYKRWAEKNERPYDYSKLNVDENFNLSDDADDTAP